ncbi:hypothetical protein GCM10020370_58640 [Paenibacillus hodogayensis]
MENVELRKNASKVPTYDSNYPDVPCEMARNVDGIVRPEGLT